MRCACVVRCRSIVLWRLNVPNRNLGFCTANFEGFYQLPGCVFSNFSVVYCNFSLQSCLYFAPSIPHHTFHTQYIKANLHKENTLSSNDVMNAYYFYSDVQKIPTEPKPRSGVKTEPKPTKMFRSNRHSTNYRHMLQRMDWYTLVLCTGAFNPGITGFTFSIPKSWD